MRGRAMSDAMAPSEVSDPDDGMMPLLPITTPATLEACRTLNLDEQRTVFACSHPKSGTTWLQAMLYEIVTKGELALDHISNYSPFYESAATWDFREERPVVQRIQRILHRLQPVIIIFEEKEDGDRETKRNC